MSIFHLDFDSLENVNIAGANKSPFGDNINVGLTPSFYSDFIYGINEQIIVLEESNGGTVTTNNGKLIVQSGTDINGRAVFRSRRPIKYRQGQGSLIRFTGGWVESFPDSEQIIGAGNDTDGVFFGFNGNEFGILHRNKSVDNWINQSSWNRDKCDGTGKSGFNIDTTKGNIFQIKYPYLGYGVISYYVLDPKTDLWILVHAIEYPNINTETEFGNPNFYMWAETHNLGNSNNLSMYSGSVAFFVIGERSFVSNSKQAVDFIATIDTTETPILQIKNCLNYNNINNTSLIRLNSISIASQTSNRGAIIRFKYNPTLDSTNFIAREGATADNGDSIIGQSISSFSNIATTISGGSYRFNMSISPNGTSLIDVRENFLYIPPGEVLSISGITAGGSAVIFVSINWTEDI